MYYNYRKQICTALFVIVLIGDFLIGKSMAARNTTKKTILNTTSASTVEKNINYGEAINISGVNYSSTVTVTKANIDGTNTNTLKVDVIENDSNGVVDYKLIAYGDSNNVLNSQETSFDQNTKTYEYNITFDTEKDKKVKLLIYPLTNDMKNNSDLKLDNAAFGESVLNMDLIKQATINAIKGTDGGSGAQ